MRRLRRLALAGALLVGLAALIGGAVGGFIDPPVVAKPQGGPSIPPAEQVQKASCRTPDGVELRGLFFPSDPGAPVVVHYMESGASPVVSSGGRYQYRELSARGFASLVIDYRGVGNSDGERSLRDLGVDARAIWEEALRRVEGDESRLLVRATSLGSVATAWLLESGARPAAIMLHAPVEAESVVQRFGSRIVPTRLLGVPIELVTRPFLRDWGAPPTLQAALGSGVPLFVSAHVEDPLLSVEEIEGLRKLTAEGACVLVEPEREEYEDSPWPVLLDGHFDLSIQALHLSDAELAFLKEHFPALPPASRRVDELLAGLDDPAAAAALLEDGATRARLELLLTELRRPHPLAAVAAAARLTDEEIRSLRWRGCTKWLLEPWAALELESAAPEAPSLDELLEVFDLGEDPKRREQILRGLDRGRGATLARSRFGPGFGPNSGDGEWWSAEGLREAVALARGPELTDEQKKERPDLVVLGTALTLLELEMGLMMGEDRVDGPERDEIVTETLLRAAWLPVR